MSAAFSLEPLDVESQCGFPNCTGRAFHEGEHQFASQKPTTGRGRKYRCTICKTPIIEYGEIVPGAADLCESQECLLVWCRITSNSLQPLRCNCPQRPYAHDVTIHTMLRRESYNPARRYCWPWSLVLADRLEPSAETEAAA